MVKRTTNARWPAAAGWPGFVLSLPLLALLWLYRRLVSPVLPPACRYYPSCSTYAEEAVRLHGPVRGPWLAARRLLRCHPWSPGGFDPVPGSDLPPFEAGPAPAGASAQRTG